MKPLRPFISFFGAKWRTIKKYPVPVYPTIIEPFAGSASYSLYYYDRQVQLNDADPVIYSVWDYVIKSKPEEILSLPVVFDSICDLSIPQEAKWLIGFWLNKAVTVPKLSPSAWMRRSLVEGSFSQFWGVSIRERIARQSSLIKHWEVTNKSYTDFPNTKATWFVDPPYHRSGHLYNYAQVDYGILANWCKNRLGQVIVCEQQGAAWLEFKFLLSAKSVEGPRGKKVSTEVIWTN